MPAKARRLPARRRQSGKTALVLAGGGVTGGIYQLGVLRALDDILLNRSTLDFDIYVGTSAGAFVATLLAIGIPPRAVAEAARNPSLSMQWQLLRHVFSPNLGELGQRILRLPRRMPAIASDIIRHRGNFLISDLWAFISLILPSGLLDSRQLGAFMRMVLELSEMPTQFSQLQRELYVVACEVDTWQRVVFGRDTKPPVSIPDAVAASAAIPILFSPVRINGAGYVDGGVKGTAAVDVAIDHGAELIVVVNPLVPLDVRGVKKSTYLHRFGNSVADLGIRGVYNQLARGVIHDGLADHIRLLRQKHPKVDIVVIEPRPDDEKMFFHEVMSTSARLVVAQHGYESVLEGLSRNYRHFAAVLGRHGIELSPHVLEGRPWEVPVRAVENGELPEKLERTIFGAGRGRTPAGRRFERVMDRIEAELGVYDGGVPAAKKREPAVAGAPAAAPAGTGRVRQKPAAGRRSRAAGKPASSRSS
jgi:predicted acylesterase/phospholipase RssA